MRGNYPARIGPAINRALLLLSLAAIVAGLLLDQWRIVLRNAIALCYSCIGLG